MSTTLTANLLHYCRLCALRRGLVSPVREERAETIQALVLLRDTTGVRRALRSADPWVRTQAIKGMVQLDQTQAVRWLGRALADDSPVVAHTAAECLAHLDGPDVVPALRRCITAEDWQLRFFGAMGLARTGSPDVLPLLEALQGDEHEWVRAQATQALRRLRSEP